MAKRVEDRRPGGTDVAQIAGVSQRTVSRVFNNEPHVSEDVRRRVMDAAASLGYRPNVAARALNTGRTRRVGVASTGTALFGPSALMVALEREVRGAGYSLAIANSFGPEAGGLSAAIGELLSQGVDALILSEPMDMGDEEVVVDVPVLTIGHAPHVVSPKVLSVSAAEGGQAAAAATQYLLSLGHETVHHLAGPQTWWSARERMQHWRDTLAAMGAPIPECQEGDWTPDSGYRLGQHLAQDPTLSALFVANDDMAIGALHALAEAGRDVPGDVSVIGFDDIPAAAHTLPPLTTISSDNAVLAAMGVEYLLAYLDDSGESTIPSAEPPPTHVHRLVIRQSTAPASRRAKGGPPRTHG